jgi:hypothetical protein
LTSCSLSKPSRLQILYHQLAILLGILSAETLLRDRSLHGLSMHGLSMRPGVAQPTKISSSRCSSLMGSDKMEGQQWHAIGDGAGSGAGGAMRDGGGRGGGWLSDDWRCGGAVR